MLVVKKLPADAGDTRDTGWIPGLERSSGGEKKHWGNSYNSMGLQ